MSINCFLFDEDSDHASVQSTLPSRDHSEFAKATCFLFILFTDLGCISATLLYNMAGNRGNVYLEQMSSYSLRMVALATDLHQRLQRLNMQGTAASKGRPDQEELGILRNHGRLK